MKPRSTACPKHTFLPLQMRRHGVGVGLGGTQNLHLWLRYVPATQKAAILTLALTPGSPASQPKMNVFKMVSKEL